VPPVTLPPKPSKAPVGATPPPLLLEEELLLELDELLLELPLLDPLLEIPPELLLELLLLELLELLLELLLLPPLLLLELLLELPLLEPELELLLELPPLELLLTSVPLATVLPLSLPLPPQPASRIASINVHFVDFMVVRPSQIHYLRTKLQHKPDMPFVSEDGDRTLTAAVSLESANSYQIDQAISCCSMFA